MNKRFCKIGSLLLLSFSFALLMYGSHISTYAANVTTTAAVNPQPAAVMSAAPRATVHFPQNAPATLKPMLTWTKVDGAVAYEIELVTFPDKTAEANCFLTTKRIYVNGYNPDLSDFKDITAFYWRVRGLDLDINPVSPFSDYELVYVDRQQYFLHKPVPTAKFNQSPGAALLYPVYAWIPIAGAEKYEVELLDAPPENPNDVAPSVHRIDTATATGFDWYDEKPRLSTQPLYWRVRGLDHAGQPVGVYSDAEAFWLNPAQPTRVATYGDSITHGGGSVSYSPADWEFSYQNYLDFPTINLARSGDISTDLVERFEQDVLPFHPQYLLILGGTNSLRANASAETVIHDLKALKEKCISQQIQPIFLTIPPINPANIAKAFQQATAPDWQNKINKVNTYIRTQTHIDIAREFEDPSGILPTYYAMDGLHPDAIAKKKIADAINAYWANTPEAEQQP